MKNSQQDTNSRLPKQNGGLWRWLNLVALFIVLEIAIRSVEQANWITPQPSLSLTLILAILVIFLVSKLRFHGITPHLIVLATGILITGWQATILLPVSAGTSIFSRLAVALLSNKPSESTVHFAVFILAVVWLAGYVSAWFVLHKNNGWIAILLGMTILLVNLTQLTEDYTSFFLYLVLSVCFLALLNLTKRQTAAGGFTCSKSSLAYYLVVVVVCSLLVVSLAWRTPQLHSDWLESFVSSRAVLVRKNAVYSTNLFAAVPRKQAIRESYDEQVLSFSHSFEREGENIEFIVKSGEPYYWRSRVFDYYTSSGWVTSTTVTSANGTGGGQAADQLRQEVTYTVTPKLKTDIMLVAGDFISADIPATVQSLPFQRFTINLVSGDDDALLPPDVAALASQLRSRQEAGELTLNELKHIMPDSMVLTSIGSARHQPTDTNYTALLQSSQLDRLEVSHIAETTEDALTVTAPYFLKTNQSYSITAQVPRASDADLAAAGEVYPRWVVDNYLQLPASLPARVRELTRMVTRRTNTPLDKVKAINNFLEQKTYSSSVAAVPDNSDGVDYFIFSEQPGNCVYFASAMTVMLRSAGVPARLAIGYLPGQWDASLEARTVRMSDYHAWPEVYFPEYGWVQFEATPAAEGSAEGGWEDSTIIPDDVVTEVPALPAAYPEWLGPIVPVMIIGAILSVVGMRAIILRWLGRFRSPDYAFEIYSKLCFIASLARLRPQPQQTPLEYSSRLATDFPGYTEALQDIARAYSESTFSRRKIAGAQQRKSLQKAWRQVYPQLLKRIFGIK